MFLRTLLEWDIGRRLRAVPGVVEVNIWGGETKQFQVVVDPNKDSLKSKFGSAKQIYLPLHAVIRVDEVDREKVSRMHAGQKGSSEVRAFPVPLYPPPASSGKRK